MYFHLKSPIKWGKKKVKLPPFIGPSGTITNGGLFYFMYNNRMCFKSKKRKKNKSSSFHTKEPFISEEEWKELEEEDDEVEAMELYEDD